MKLREFLNPTLTWRSLLLLGIGGVVAVVVVDRLVDPLGFHAKRESIGRKLRVGLTESEVIRLLGRAPAARYDKPDAPTDYYVEGWARRERPITGSVLIFRFGEPICYVWFDEQGRVEDYFVGGS